MCAGSGAVGILGVDQISINQSLRNSRNQCKAKWIFVIWAIPIQSLFSLVLRMVVGLGTSTHS